jgi:hypothetical protein
MHQTRRLGQLRPPEDSSNTTQSMGRLPTVLVQTCRRVADREEGKNDHLLG